MRALRRDRRPAPAGWERCEAWVARRSPATPPSARSREDDDLYQMYTSGTTGRPKGAVLQQRAVCANSMQSRRRVRVTRGERYLIVAPIYHAAAAIASFCDRARGRRRSASRRTSSRPTSCARSSEERIAVALLVPAMIQACLVAVPDVAKRRYDGRCA